jgi:ribosomal protein L6P/L9E
MLNKIFIMQSKSILIPQNLKISLVLINTNKFLVFKNLSNIKYVSAPLSSLCSKNDNLLTLSYNSSNANLLAQFNQFVTRVDATIKSLNNTYRKKLTLKGLGFRITLIENKKIEFKLGFSHLIQLNIPQNLKVKIKKNFIFLESNNNVLLGNFMDKIISLKAPDSYKGKGF